MSLDHDLDAPHCGKCKFDCGIHEAEKNNSCKHGCDCHRDGDENGLDLLHWMHQAGRWPKEKPKVHSANLVGALRMKRFIAQHWPGGD